jgi:hypothetical protein
VKWLWTSLALPFDKNDEVTAIKATTALYSGMIDMKPADPIEGIIISQLMAASQSSLAMYHKAWAQPAKYFEAHTKYLALADKAARTVALLTERLDHHRNRSAENRRSTYHRQCRPSGSPTIRNAATKKVWGACGSMSSLATGSRVKVVGRDPVLRVEDIRPA